MSKEKIDENGVEMITTQIEKLEKIIQLANQDNDVKAARLKLKRWKSSTINLLSEKFHPEIGEELKSMKAGSLIVGQPLRNLTVEAYEYRDFLSSLRKESRERPVKTRYPNDSRIVFIVHGHDELNTLRLKVLLKEHLNIEPIVLVSKPGVGRTNIEKFEQEAQKVSYAIALFTPDDKILNPAANYFQARPNVIFELGWFCGRLGRKRVLILLKKGTTIYSDLEGINRIEFSESIEDKVKEIENELKAAELI